MSRAAGPGHGADDAPRVRGTVIALGGSARDAARRLSDNARRGQTDAVTDARESTGRESTGRDGTAGRRRPEDGDDLRVVEPGPGFVRVGPPTADLPELTVGETTTRRRDRAALRAGRAAARDAAEATQGAGGTSDGSGGATLPSRRGSRLPRRRTWVLVAAGVGTIALVAQSVVTGWHGLVDGGSKSAQLVTAGSGLPTPEPTASVAQDPLRTALGSAISTTRPDPSERTSSELRVGLGSLPLLSGLPWASGVYVPGSDKGKIAEFAAFRGRPVDVVVDWSARQTWNDIVNPTWLYDAWEGTPYTKVFGVAPIPEDGSGNLQACGQGAYDDKWRQFGDNIKAKGLDDETIVRLGWEFNGDWYAWSAHDPGAFAACFRKVVSAAESTAPGLRWDWNVNRGKGQSVNDARAAYPGDAYVDIIGIDSYDMWPGATDDRSWNQHLNGAYGLKFWVDFAKQHGKKVSIPEWGVFPGTAQAGANGGDNPFYISKMHAFFDSLGDQLAYEAYFNEDQSYYAGSLFGPVQNPAASIRYAALF